MQLSTFFDQDYTDFSVYDNVRKIASYVDGLKNAQRKVVYTLLETNCDNFVKVSNLGPRVQDFAQYLHGSLEGGIVNMTQDYVGSGNNIPMLIGDGNFGTAFIPQAAASRYIFAKSNPIVKDLFIKEDNICVGNQAFEGDKIEPKYYMPTIPLILANAQEGLSIGFAQKILPRNPKELVKWVEQKASGKRVTADLTPYWNGQKFSVTQGETSSQWVITGKFERLSNTKMRIDVLPIGYDLKGYQKVLDKLVDDKVIKDYDDLSDADEFCFGVEVTRDFSKKPDEDILKIFKLEKRISENYTCVDRNNKVVQFDHVKDLLEAWWIDRLEHNGIRQSYIASQLEEKYKAAEIKKIFIEGVLNDQIEIRGTPEAQVEKQAVKHSNILNGHVKDLLKLPMRQLTEEEIIKLDKQMKEVKKELKRIKSMSLEDFSIEDMQKLKTSL